MKLNNSDIQSYIEKNITTYHEKIFQRLLSLKLPNVLKRKNPYLFKAKAIETAPEIVKAILDAYLSSQEEGIFGSFLEELSIYICGTEFRGHKSSAEGIDLEFDRDQIHYIVSIKSGPNWGNSQQIARMKDNFNKAKRILGTNRSKQKIVPINGCCYGREKNYDKGEYLKLCGQRYWELISANENLYTDIIEPLGHRAKQRNTDFKKEYAKVINRITRDFIDKFCNEDGSINWFSIVEFNSGK